MTRGNLVRELAPLISIFLGAVGQKLFHRGVESGLLFLGAVVVALSALDLVARAFGLARGRARWIWVGLSTLGGVLAVVVYPVPESAWRTILAAGLAGLAIDVAAVRETTLARATAALAVLFAAATHVVSACGPPNYDSAIYFANGRWVLAGLVPYRDFYLNKSPGLLFPNVLYAALGDPYITPQVVSLLCVVATGVILAREVAGSTRWLVLAGASVLASLHVYRGGGNFPETYALPFLALAWARLAREAPSRCDLVVGGVALAALGCLKQTHALYTLAGLALAAARELRHRETQRALIPPFACAATVALVFGPLLIGAGAGPVFEWTILHWVRPRATVAQEGTLAERLVRVVIAPAWPLFLASFAFALALVVRGARRRELDAPSAGWLSLVVVSWVLLAIEQRVFANPHYVLHALVPLALVPFVAERLGLARPWVLVFFAGSLGWCAAGEVVGVRETLEKHQADKGRLLELARAVDRTPPAPSVPLIAAGGPPEVYIETVRACAAPFALNAIAICQVAERGEAGRAEIREIFRTKRPVVLLGREEQTDLAALDATWPGWRAELLQGYEAETLGRVSILRPR